MQVTSYTNYSVTVKAIKAFSSPIIVYTTDENYTSSAEFVCSEGKISNTATQNFVDKNVENFPMRAVSSNKDLAFKNLCGIIRFCLKTEESGQVKVSSISLSADKGMSGAFSVGDNNAAVVSGSDGVVLNCAEPEMLYATSATDFNIIVPQGNYNQLKVKICDADGKEVNLVSEGSVSVTRSQITRITLTLAKSTFETSLETIPITDSNVDFTER